MVGLAARGFWEAKAEKWALGASLPENTAFSASHTIVPRTDGDDIRLVTGARTCHGWKMQFVNPLTGGHAMPTIAAFIQLLPKGFATRPYRSTDGTIYSVVEGNGRVKIGGESFEFEPRDSFVAPSWATLEIESRGESVLFSFSDRPGQEAMGLWREKRG